MRRQPPGVAFPFPLSTGQIAIFNLPLPLSKQDAERAGEYLLAIATTQAGAEAPATPKKRGDRSDT